MEVVLRAYFVRVNGCDVLQFLSAKRHGNGLVIEWSVLSVRVYETLGSTLCQETECPY